MYDYLLSISRANREISSSSNTGTSTQRNTEYRVPSTTYISGWLCYDGQIQRLGSELLSLVLLKTLLMKTSSANEHSQTYTVYVTLTSVSRDWHRTIIGQPWFHATPTQPELLREHDDGK